MFCILHLHLHEYKWILYMYTHNTGLNQTFSYPKLVIKIIFCYFFYLIKKITVISSFSKYFTIRGLLDFSF